MDRRNFLKQVAVWSSGILLAEPVFRITPGLLASEAVSPILSVGTGKEYTSLVSAVLKPLGGIAAFVKPGDRVVVKPNIGFDRFPRQAATTNPEVVAAVVEMCLEAGAKKVIISAPASAKPDA